MRKVVDCIKMTRGRKWCITFLSPCQMTIIMLPNMWTGYIHYKEYSPHPCARQNLKKQKT